MFRFIRHAILPIFILASTVSFAQREKYIYNPQKNGNSSATHKLPETQKKEIYRIDFLLPLSLKDLPAKPTALTRIPNGSRVGVNFYEGILLAIDSIEESGNSYFDFFIHDVSNSEDLKALFESKTLDSTDLIIGAVTSGEVKEIADFALEKQINFMSVLSPASAGIINNPYFILIQPSLQSHIEQLFDFAENKIGAYNSVLIFNDDAGDFEVFSFYKNKLRRFVSEIKLENGFLETQSLIQKLKPNEKNIVYTTMLSQVAAANFLEKIKSIPPEYDVEVIGLPSWKGLKALEDGSIPDHIKVYITSPFSFDSDTEKMKIVQIPYRRFNRGIPTEIVYRGFETTLWASELLTNYGTIFNKQMHKQKGFFSDYNVISRYDHKGKLVFMENNALNIYQYKSGNSDIKSD